MKNKLSFLFICICTSLFAQQKITWEDLADVTYEDKYFPEWKDYFKYPTWGGSVKALEGKQIKIKGYYIDVDPMGKLIALSKNNMTNCFFCGAAGPETTLEIQYAKPQTFKTDDIVEFTGVLKLNRDDVEHFNYILTNAKGVLIE